MKYICKTEYYESPKVGQGTFKNPYAVTRRPAKREVNGKLHLEFNFDLAHLRNGVEEIIETTTLPFVEHQPTIILNDDNEEVDIRVFLMSGGTYHKDKIVSWGRPSAYIMEHDYLDPISWDGNSDIQLISKVGHEVQRQIAKDWIDASVLIHSQAISANFELEEL